MPGLWFISRGEILSLCCVSYSHRSGGASGQASDIAIHAKEILEVRKRLNQIYVKHTNKELSAIEKIMERDTFMSPQQALEFGLIDKIMEKRI
jgi:ATP-dependent Clp protease protease subunit